MAMNKIERIDREIAKTREKITEYQNKLRGLEAQKTEAENLQIVQLVRSMRLSPHELSAMLSGGGIPGMEAAPGYPAEPNLKFNEENGNPFGTQEEARKMMESWFPTLKRWKQA